MAMSSIGKTFKFPFFGLLAPHVGKETFFVGWGIFSPMHGGTFSRSHKENFSEGR